MHSLILVRHSLPEVVPGVSGKLWHLSEEGRRRSRIIAGQFAFYHPVIFASGEFKAQETASLLSSSLDLSFETVEDLREHERNDGEWFDAATFKTTQARFFAQPNELVFGRETATQVRQRFTDAIEDILHKHPKRNILIVTHATVITLFVAQYTTIDPFSFWESLDTPSFVVLPLPPG